MRKNKISDYINEVEIRRLDLEFEKFLKNKSAPRRAERKINFNRFKQSIKVIFINFFLLPFIFRNYFILIFTKNYPLRSTEISLTYKCNATCEQCSCRLYYDPNKKRLTIDEWKKAIDESIKLGAFQFNITGGEPLLFVDECLELIKYIKSKGRYVHLCSNALLMNVDIMQKLKESGLNSLEMGLDSADEKKHNGNRQENSYKKIMETIKLAKKVGIKTIILNTIITHEKIKNHDMLALMNLAKGKGVILQITPPCVTGAWKNRLDILLNQRERLYLRWLLAKYPYSRMDTYSSYFGIRCPAAREKIGIHPYGDVVSCPLIQIIYGNIKNEELKKIREKMLENPYYHIVSREGCLPSFNRDFIDKYMLDK
jgi:MoaA/NifB/PqqE/SkfB family radical SAM enzyme